MDSSNHWYGHAHIMARYAGLDDVNPPTIWGVVQHGWNLMHGFGPGHAPPYGFPKFVWSDVNRRRGQALGWRDYYVIGAPWAYLLTEFDAPPPREERQGTIVYPFHTWENSEIEGSHHELIEEIKDTETGPVTACLYWIEYEMPEVRQAYEDAGFRVITNGQRGTLRQGTDTEFLYRQHRELVRHRRVISNRLTTAIFYGASVGCDVAVYGDPMVYVDAREGYEDLLDVNDMVRRLYPELHGTHTDPDVAHAIARFELGMDQLLNPAELKEVLGWRDAPSAEHSDRKASL